MAGYCQRFRSGKGIRRKEILYKLDDPPVFFIGAGGISKVLHMFLNKSCFSQKTKATPKDHHFARNSDKQTNSVRLTYGVLAVHQAGGPGLEKIRRPQIEEAGECRQLKTVGRTKKCTLPDYQPFGSMPRCCSSLRSMRFIQVANDESPSLRISSSSWARNSSGNLIWYCGDFFNSCIDTCNYPYYYLYCVITRVITFTLKSNEVPQVVTTPTGLLTTSDS